MIKIAFQIVALGVFCFCVLAPAKAGCRFAHIKITDPSCDSGFTGCLLFVCDDGTAGASCGCLIQTQLQPPADRNEITLWGALRRNEFESLNSGDAWELPRWFGNLLA